MLIGIVHCNLDEFDRAIAMFTRALELGHPYPSPSELMARLATVYENKGEPQQAEHWFKQSIARDPTFWPACVDLGCLYANTGRTEEGIKWCLKGRELSDRANEKDKKNIKDVVSRYNLVTLMMRTKKPDEAKRYWDEADQIQHADPKRRFAFGVGLMQQGRPLAALEQFEQVSKDDPQAETAFGNVGWLSVDTGQPARAKTAFIKACALKPDRGTNPLGLGRALMLLGEYREALAAFAEAQRHIAAGTPQQKELDSYVPQCKERVALEGKLKAFCEGKVKPASTPEARILAAMCREKGRYADALRLWEQILAGEKQTAEQITRAGDRYNAACVAVLVSEEAGAPEKPGLRTRALDWLRADLAEWGRMVKEKAAARALLRRSLAHWKVDPNLAPVRDGASVERLPARERDGWRRFWAEVEKQLHIAN
jgi:tetratricopeptide (TPR) repeat protein